MKDLPVPKRIGKETRQRWRRKTIVMHALYELHQEYYAVDAFTMYDIARKSRELGHEIKASTYLMKVIKELFREGEIGGYEGVHQTNKDGRKIVAYYWFLHGYQPVRQQSMFPDEGEHN